MSFRFTEILNYINFNHITKNVLQKIPDWSLLSFHFQLRKMKNTMRVTANNNFIGTERIIGLLFLILQISQYCILTFSAKIQMKCNENVERL